MNTLAVDIGNAFNSPFGTQSTLADLVSVGVTASIVIAGVCMLFLFIAGGLGVIAGAGNSDPQAAAKGKQAVTWSVAGFFIVFVAYWIVRIIELITGSNFFTVPGL